MEMTQAQPNAAEQQPPAEQASQGPGDKAGKAYRGVITAAMMAIYSPEASERLIQMMGTGEPAQAVADATLTVLDELKGKMKGINPNFVYAAASAVAGMLFEMGEAAGLFKFEKQMMFDAMKIMGQKLKGQQAPEQPMQPAGPEQPVGAGLISSAMGA